MADKKDLTPEKQLLGLIESQKGAGSLRSAAIRYQRQSFFSFPALRGRLRFFRQRFSAILKLRDPSQLDIKAINDILKLVVFTLAFYLLASSVASTVKLQRGLNISVVAEGKAASGTSSVTPLLKAGSYYLEKARGRDIFNMGPKKVSPDIQRGPSQRLIDATQHLRLVGISWSNDPDVMIEDTKNQRTLFLKKGQVIENEIKLQAVFRDKVILSLQGEEIELK